MECEWLSQRARNTDGNTRRAHSSWRRTVEEAKTRRWRRNVFVCRDACGALRSLRAYAAGLSTRKVRTEKCCQVVSARRAHGHNRWVAASGCSLRECALAREHVAAPREPPCGCGGGGREPSAVDACFACAHVFPRSTPLDMGSFILRPSLRPTPGSDPSLRILLDL